MGEVYGRGWVGGEGFTAGLSIALCLPHISVSAACVPPGSDRGGGGLRLVKSDESAA